MKVLILAYDFPPLISIGALRPYSWYKYLPDNDISVTVVTRQWTDKISSSIDYVQATSGQTVYESDNRGNQIIRTNFQPNLRDRILIKYGLSKMTLLRKIMSFLYSFLEHLFWAFDSKSGIYFEAEKAIQQSKPDVIIATAEPFILFKYGHKLAGKYNIPWIADYRDGWTTNQGNYSLGLLSGLQNRYFRRAEKKYVSNTAVITTTSPTYAADLAKIRPDKDIHVIYNGYDDGYFQNTDAIRPPSDKFVISYAGTIYPHQNLEMFLEGLNKFLVQEPPGVGRIEIRFFGIESQLQAKERLLNYQKNLHPFIVLEPRIPYGELVKKLRASHLLLLLSKNGANWLNAKIFDYLAVKRKILLVENDHGIMEKLLLDADGITANSADEVCEILKLEYGNFKKGKVNEMKLTEQIKQYSRKYQAGRFADLLRKI